MDEQRHNHCGQDRNIAFDILRMAAMLMVTMLHITGHGLRKAEIEAFSSTYWIALVFNTFSLTAVNCFVLISGYFLSEKSTSPKKISSLWFQVWTYSVGIYVVLCLIPGANVSVHIKTLVECCCPLLSNQYWFFTCYFLLYLTAPILNKLTAVWSQQEHKAALMVLIVAFSVIPSVNVWGDSFGTNHGYSLVWFVVLYLIAAYIRKYSPHWPVHPLISYAIPCAILCVFQAVITAWKPENGSVQAVLSGQSGYNGPLILCASVGLLVWAKNAAFHVNGGIAKAVTAMASLSFGVYLLQDHGTIRPLLWNDWVCLADVVGSGGAFLCRVIWVLVILFAAGLAVEFVRKKIAGCLAHIFQSEKHI